MKYQEKKFKVNSFGAIKGRLSQLGAKKIKHAVETHYYAQIAGNDVVKLVDYQTKSEIHVLSESNGTFKLTDTIPVKDITAGMKRLKDDGHGKTTTVKMIYDEYELRGGIVGLYIINDSLYSVILDFPPEKFKEIELDLGLEHAQVITVPYNKYLEGLIS